MQTIRLTRRQLAERWGLRPNTLAHWATDGKGPKYIPFAGKALYDLEDVEQYEREHFRAVQSSADYDHGGGKSLDGNRPRIGRPRAHATELAAA